MSGGESWSDMAAGMRRRFAGYMYGEWVCFDLFYCPTQLGLVADVLFLFRHFCLRFCLRWLQSVYANLAFYPQQRAGN